MCTVTLKRLRTLGLDGRGREWGSRSRDAARWFSPTLSETRWLAVDCMNPKVFATSSTSSSSSTTGGMHSLINASSSGFPSRRRKARAASHMNDRPGFGATDTSGQSRNSATSTR